MSSLWLALIEPCVLKQSPGHNKVPMFFWGPITGPGVIRKQGWLLRYEIYNVSSLRNRQFFSLIDLDPDGCLAEDQLRVRNKTIENPDAVNEKGLIQLWLMSLQKIYTFLRCWGVFS